MELLFWIAVALAVFSLLVFFVLISFVVFVFSFLGGREGEEIDWKN
jgi:hypothetical protein